MIEHEDEYDWWDPQPEFEESLRLANPEAQAICDIWNALIEDAPKQNICSICHDSVLTVEDPGTICRQCVLDGNGPRRPLTGGRR